MRNFHKRHALMAVSQWPAYVLRGTPPDTRQLLSEQAEEDDISPADVVRQALCRHYNTDCDHASSSYQPTLDRNPEGLTPADEARLAGTLFQGEKKSAVLELHPLRYDGSRGELLLAGRLRVRLAFEGGAPGETGSGGSVRLARRGVKQVRDVLAQLYASGRGLHAVWYEEVFPGSRRALETSLLRLQRDGEAVAFHVEPVSSVFGPGSVLYFHVERGARSTDFTAEAAYELVRSADGRRMEVVPPKT